MALTMTDINRVARNQLTADELMYLRLRAYGNSFEEIGLLYGVKRQSIHEAVTKALKKLEAQGVQA